MKDISVIICTYNRCESLRETLDSLLKQEHDENLSYEVIVVDNNSTDATRQVVESYTAAFGDRLRYVFEPKQGLSNARNAGVTNAKGEIAVFTDDDCIVSKYWLKSINDVFTKSGADCVFGKILPIWEIQRLPGWLIRNKKLWACLALLDYGDKELRIYSEKRPFFGANFALKMEVLKNIGPFNAKLGRIGKILLAGEDTELFENMLLLNNLIIYNPDIYVYHKIENSRATKRYFFKWYFFSGISQSTGISKTRRSIFGIPLWVMKKTGLEFVSFFKYLLCFNSTDSFRYQLKCTANFGTCFALIKREYSHMGKD